MVIRYPSLRRSLSRVWQPRRGLFWLMVAFNVMGWVLGWALHLLQPTGGLLVLVTVFALGNAAMGWWLLLILWRDGAETSSGENADVQSFAGQQDR